MLELNEIQCVEITAKNFSLSKKNFFGTISANYCGFVDTYCGFWELQAMTNVCFELYLGLQLNIEHLFGFHNSLNEFIYFLYLFANKIIWN